MKILEHRQLTDLSPAKVQFIRIDPEDISATLADILKVLMDMSWLKNFDAEYERGAFASKADKTINDIKSARYLLFASLLYEDNRRLLSKIKTVEGFEPYDLVRVDPESVPEGYRTENIYGFPHGHLLIK